MDSLLVVDGLAESVLDKEFKTQELFIHHQVERPMAIYQLSSPDHVVDTDQLMKKLKSANESIFRIFLTDDELQYDSLLKAGMGWAQPI